MLCGLGAAATSIAAPAPVLQVSSSEDAESPRTDWVTTAVARDGEQLVVWSAPAASGGQLQLWGRMIGQNETPNGAPFEISQPRADGEPVNAVTPAVAARGRRGEFFVVWTQDDLADNGGERSELYGRRIGASGTPLSEPFVLASRDRFERLGRAAVAYGGDHHEFVVVWEGVGSSGGWDIYGTRIQAGRTSPGKTFKVSPHGFGDKDNFGANDPTIAFDSRAGSYLVAWEGKTDEFGARGNEVYARALTDVPNSLGRTRRVSGFTTTGQMLLRPDLVYNRRTDEYVVVWSPGQGDEQDLFARRIRPSGRPRGPETDIGTSTAWAADIAVAPGGHYVVAFQVGLESTSVVRRRVGRKLRAGRVREVSTAAPAGGPSVVYSRAVERFVAAWLQAVPPDQDENLEVFVRQL
jgi:hypothetical protein